MEVKDAKWKSIAGLALMNVYDPESKARNLMTVFW